MDTTARDLQHQLRAILDCSQQMLERVEGREWDALDALDALEETRQRLLVKLFSTPPEPSEVALLLSSMQQLLTLDGEIAERMERVRQALVKEMIALNLGRQTQLAYSENAR